MGYGKTLGAISSIPLHMKNREFQYIERSLGFVFAISFPCWLCTSNVLNEIALKLNLSPTLPPSSPKNLNEHLEALMLDYLCLVAKLAEH